jgi:hypothetical protein
MLTGGNPPVYDSATDQGDSSALPAVLSSWSTPWPVTVLTTLRTPSRNPRMPSRMPSRNTFGPAAPPLRLVEFAPNGRGRCPLSPGSGSGDGYTGHHKGMERLPHGRSPSRVVTAAAPRYLAIAWQTLNWQVGML